MRPKAIADLTLDYDGRGNLTGTLAGSTPERTANHPDVFRQISVAPGTFSAKLVGSYTPGPEYIFRPSRRRADNARPGSCHLHSRTQ